MSKYHLATPAGRKRARALGVPFLGTPGKLNAITDVTGLEVGYHTLIKGKNVRTGVTAILPLGRKNVGLACAAATHSFNGNGEMTGVSWINEAGSVNTPVMITNTHAVGPIHRGTLDWCFKQAPKMKFEWLLPVVAETWDGFLNDIGGSHVRPEMAGMAIMAARAGAIEEGSVGGGTGMNCYPFKGGNGTASRMVRFAGKNYAVGVFMQCNFGSRDELTIAGHHMWQRLKGDNPMADYYSKRASGAGSCIGIVATNAPLLPGQLAAMARRMQIGIARTGTTGSHFSGDIYLAFSTANSVAFESAFPDAKKEKLARAQFVPWSFINDFYDATVYAAEEAVINALVANDTMIGRDGNRSPALPHEAVAALFRS